MAKVDKKSSSISRRAALTPEARENQLIAAAVDLAEKQILEGTASSQIITHFLKLATEKTRLDVEKEKREIALLEAKTQSIESSQRSEELYREALEAFRTYSGQGGSDDY